MSVRCARAVVALVCGMLIMACGEDEAAPPPAEDVAVAQDSNDEADTAVTPTGSACEGPPRLHTPRWAFEPWISKDITNADDTRPFVAGFRERDIPVGAIVLDSPWETHYNTFVPHPDGYPGFEGLVAELNADDIRVILWITQMVNSVSIDTEVGGYEYPGPSPNHAEAIEKGYLIDEGKEYYWWKGFGGGLDFFNEDAVQWWHAQQDFVLEAGISGWKLDFGDSYVDSDPVQTAIGPVPHQEYSEAYYRDYLQYGQCKRGDDEFVTMVRAWDESYDRKGRFHARPEHAPVCWMGDNRRDWLGLTDAMDHLFRSAVAGYVVLGTDVGGYLDFNDVDITEQIPFDQAPLDAWTAMGALTPFMQLHGRGNLTPWTVPKDPETFVGIYRYWSKLHHQLVPFFYSLAEQGYETQQSILRPVGDAADWPGDYRYLLGEALLVAPILDATGIRDVTLPAGAQWFDWWKPEEGPLDAQTLAAYDATDRLRIPVFIRGGAIIPLNVSDDSTGLGDAGSAGHTTLVVYPAPDKSTFTLVELDERRTVITAQRAASGQATVTLERAAQPVKLRVRAETEPTSVTLDGAEHAFTYDAAQKAALVTLEAAEAAVTVVLK